MIIRVHRVYCGIVIFFSTWYMCSVIFLAHDRLTYHSSATTNRHIHNKIYDLHKREWTANYEKLPSSYVGNGPGEFGVPVNLDDRYSEKIRLAYKEHELNKVASDMISLHRKIPDLRSQA